MRRKIVVSVIIFSLIIIPVFASTSGNMSHTGDAWGVKGITNRVPNVLSGRVLALGNTGTVLSTGIDALYMNPANLARNQKLFLDTPFLNIQIQPFAKLLKSLEGGNISAVNLLTTVVNQMLSQGNNPVLLDTNIGAGVTVKGFGANAFVNYGLYSYSPNSLGDAAIFPMLTFGITFGYGGNVYNVGPHRIDVGGSGSFMVRAYTDAYTVQEMVQDLTDSSRGMSVMDVILPYTGRKAMVGFMHPLTVGMTYTFMDTLSVSLALRDLWPSAGGMHNFESLKDGLSGIWSPSKVRNASGTVKYGFFDSGSLDIGIAWNPKWKWFNPRVEFDLYDLYHYSDAEKKDFKYFFGSHMRFGIEAFVGEFLGLRFGVDGGRLSFGARLDLWAFVLDVSYGWKEWGEYAGAKPVDYFSLVLKFGWDRTK